MRRDFDYVTMGDYLSDMGELGETAANAAAVLRQERDDARKLLALIVGEVKHVKIPEHRLREDAPTIIREYDYASMSIVFRVQP